MATSSSFYMDGWYGRAGKVWYPTNGTLQSISSNGAINHVASSPTLNNSTSESNNKYTTALAFTTPSDSAISSITSITISWYQARTSTSSGTVYGTITKSSPFNWSTSSDTINTYRNNAVSGSTEGSVSSTSSEYVKVSMTITGTFSANTRYYLILYTKNTNHVYQINPSTSSTPISATVEYTVKTFEITYNSNGGSGRMGPYSVTYGNSHTVKPNEFTAPAATLSTYTITLKPNYIGESDGSKTVTNTTPKKFSTWHQGSTSGTARAPGEKISNITSDITLYAIWIDDTIQKGTVILGSLTRSEGSTTGYEVSFDTQGGSTISSITSTRKVTYIHDGWMTSASGTEIAYDKTTAYSFTANTDLFAKWTETYTNNSIKLPSAPTKLGYKFLGWGTSANATSYKQPGEDITPSAKTTYYAIWKADGSIRIYLNDTDKYKIAMTWIYLPASDSDTKPWKLVIPYMKTSSNWKITAG